MNIRAEITIDLHADDFIVAADHQRKIEELHLAIAGVYPQAALHLRERRPPRTPRRIMEIRPAQNRTGAVSEYLD
jgi:hypothetical protein